MIELTSFPRRSEAIDVRQVKSSQVKTSQVVTKEEERIDTVGSSLLYRYGDQLVERLDFPVLGRRVNRRSAQCAARYSLWIASS